MHLLPYTPDKKVLNTMIFNTNGILKSQYVFFLCNTEDQTHGLAD